jgi:hypothetical protein
MLSSIAAFLDSKLEGHPKLGRVMLRPTAMAVEV